MNRERLTITLRNDLLKVLDSKIDGENLRNRSHAIEYFLSKALNSGLVKVLILAGGKSVYLESEKRSIPKAMVKVGGRPILQQTLQKLKAAKLTDIYISVGEGGEIIKDYFGDGSGLGVSLSYLQQKVSNGTAQPVYSAKEFFSDNFLLLYGDVVSDVDFLDLLEFHKKQAASVCTMALSSVETVSMWGLARMQGNRIVAFDEKPKNPQTFSRLINAGIYVMSPAIFDLIGVKTSKLESEIFPRLAEEGKLYGYPYEGLWLDISTNLPSKKNNRGGS